MRVYVCTALVLSVAVGLAAAGCGSSDDSSSGGSGGGASGAPSGGTTNHGGSSGSSGSSSAGTSGASAGTGGSGGTSGSGQGGSAGATVGGSGGAASAGAPDETAGAAGEGTTTPPQACNTLTNAPEATPVVIQQSAAAAPTLAQGTIQSGTFFLTGVTVYNGQTGPEGVSVSATAQVSVSDHTVTINSVDTLGQRNTIVIVTGTPTSAPPVSITVDCSDDTSFAADVGKDVTATTSYGVTGNTLSVYTSGTKILRTFTLNS